MIYGIGVDLVDISRMERVLKRWGDRFVERVFAPDEIEFCSKRVSPFHAFALRFAAKEAFSKALGTGLRGAIGWREIEVRDNGRSRPSISVTGRAAGYLAGRRVHLSITHLPDYASAVVIIEE